MRDAFSRALVTLAKQDPRVLLMTGDHGYALFDEFRESLPSQYINAGIAEQNMVGMAAGLAIAGYRPFVYGLAAFVPVRVVEQIKLDIAHDYRPVVILGDGAGFVYSHLGTSHQSLEDISCMRAIPGLEILSPADRFEMTACMNYAYNRESSVYLRMGKSDRGDVHLAPIAKIGAGRLLKIRVGHSDRPAIIATGSMVRSALAVGEKIGSSVWSAPMIKPLSAQDVCIASTSACGIVTMEEHSVYGGLGSAVAEITSSHAPTRVLRIGVNDVFSHKCGSYNYLLKEHGLDAETVQQKIVAYFNM